MTAELILATEETSQQMSGSYQTRLFKGHIMYLLFAF